MAQAVSFCGASLLVQSSSWKRSGDLAWNVPALRRRRCKSSESRLVCIAGDKNEREAAARKALEQALGEKKEVFSKWDEEIKRRETRNAGGGGSGAKGRGGGGGGGGGGRPDPRDESSWNEAKQIVFAFTGLLAFFIVITNGRNTLVLLLNLPKYLGIAGRKALAFLINFPFFVLRGFKRRPSPTVLENSEATTSAAPSRVPETATSAQAHAINKWGSD